MTDDRKNFYLGYMQALVWDQGFHGHIRGYRLPNPTEPYCMTADDFDLKFSISDLMACWAEFDDGAIHYFRIVKSLGTPSDPILQVTCTEDDSVDPWDEKEWHTAHEEEHWKHVQASWA
jgi:hypothetical protein